MFRKLLNITLSALFIINILPAVSGSFKAEAAGSYSFACGNGEFEVSYIEDDGSLSKVSCHSTFDAAKAAMKTNDDYVVRLNSSYSKTKIIAMNSGLAYSYPNRRGTNTMYLYQDPKQTGSSLYKQTYISKGYEMTYVDTYSVNSSGAGYAQVVMNGFEGFADLEYVDLVPFKYINNGIAIYLGGDHGSTVSYGNEDPYLVKLEQNYYMIETKGNYTDLVFYYHYAYGVNGNKCVTYVNSVDNGKHYLEAGMQKGVKYYSNDGINFYSDQKLNNLVATCYNYYQFLPFRTETKISAGTFDSFVSGHSDSVLRGEGQSFLDAQDAYGINALLVYAMACHESAYGESGYAVHRYNLFGWSAVDSNPNGASYFNSVQDCINAQMGRYINWFIDFTNWRYFGYCIGNKGAGLNVQYASDPYWGVGIASLAYSIDKKSKNNNGDLTDYDRYTLAYVNANYNDTLYGSNVVWDSNFYASSTGNKVLFTGRYGSHYQKDLIVPIVGEENGRYKIQTPNPIENGALVTRDGILPYDWEDSVAYINKSDVKVLYGKTQETPEPENPKDDSTYEPFTSIRNLSLNGSILSIDGIGLIQGMDFTDQAKISQKISFVDLSNEENIYTFDCNVIDSDAYSRNDGWDYTYTGFSLELDLKDSLPVGSYLVKLSTVNEDKSVETSLFSSLSSYRLLTSLTDSNSYQIRMNDSNSYRFEIDVLPLIEELDYTAVNKPSKRTSNVSLDAIELDEQGNLTINGHSYMYYLNYDVTDNIAYDVYLVSDEGDYLKLETALYDDGIDYKKELNSNYNINNISFKAIGEIDTLKPGTYTIYLKMSNIVDETTYLDINEIKNYGFEVEPITIEGITYEIGTSRIRRRLILNVTGE
ncbi:MAG: glucosaminidase domain-containing protein [Erysipelotrichaceae bacterium]|nr:glucosaminidase domain-containing protein [Erysipelotrichaceae bacterium]